MAVAREDLVLSHIVMASGRSVTRGLWLVVVVLMRVSIPDFVVSTLSTWVRVAAGILVV